MKSSFSIKQVENGLQQLAYLNTPVATPKGGMLRYGAAMYFFQRGMITPELLEIYRICSKLDNDEPLEVARLHEIEPHHITPQQLKAV